MSSGTGILLIASGFVGSAFYQWDQPSAHLSDLVETKLALEGVLAKVYLSCSVEHFFQNGIMFRSITTPDNDVVHNDGSQITREELFHQALEDFTCRAYAK